MSLSSLPKITSKKSRRIGRGHGSGRVKTAGRGTKGQKARENIKLKFAGSSLQASWLKRLPLMRGKGKNKTYRTKPVAVNLKYLNSFKAGDEITLDLLKKARIVGNSVAGVKILGDGEISIALTVKLPASKAATVKIEKAGGKVIPPVAGS